MNHEEALAKVEELLALVERHRAGQYADAAERDTTYKRICMLYGGLQEIIERFGGRTEVEVPGLRGIKARYTNYVEAGFLSGFTHFEHEGYTQLLKVVGRLRQLADDPRVPTEPSTITTVSEALGRFRPCCQYLADPPQSERDVQDIAWIILRSHFARVEREETLPRFGAKNYRPDLGLPDLRLLVEVKFVGQKTVIGDLQDELMADVPAYLGEHTAYDTLIVLIYDAAQKLLDPGAFVEALRSAEGVVDVIVVPGIG